VRPWIFISGLISFIPLLFKIKVVREGKYCENIVGRDVKAQFDIFNVVTERWIEIEEETLSVVDKKNNDAESGL